MVDSPPGILLRPLLPLFVIDILTAFTVGMVPPLLPLLADEWRLSPLEAGLVNTLYAVGRLGTSYPASGLRARRGTRAVVLLGLSLLIAGVVACGLAPGFTSFLVGRLVMGIGDHARLVFEALSDRAWQHVEKEAVRATERRIARANGVLEQHIRGDGNAADVQHEEPGAQALRDR